MKDDNPIRLSRRKMLGGVGAIGLASAGAGLGTTAYFSDEESFTDNSLTAGELDLLVHVDYSEDQGSYAQYSTPDGTYIDGGVVGGQEDGEPLQIEVSDLKPGDSGEAEFCFSIVDNPAYMWMCGELTDDDENGQTEPEAEVDDSGGDPGEGEGELADAMQVTLSYCSEEDGETVIGEEIVSDSLGDVMLALQSGVPLSGDGDADTPIDDREPFEGVESAFDDEEPNTAEQCVCVSWEVPTDVGNEIQTDSVMFDFEFYAEQARHNDGTTNPCVDETVVTEYDNDWKGQTLGNPTDGSVYTGVSYGEDQTVLSFTFVDDDDGTDFLDTADYSSTNLPVAVDADADGTHDWQLIWQPNAGFPDDPFGYKENTGGSYGSSQSLPAGFSALKVGNTISFGIPNSELSSTFRVLGYGSTGGEGPVAKVNADPTVGPDWFNSANAVEFTE